MRRMTLNLRYDRRCLIGCRATTLIVRK